MDTNRLAVLLELSRHGSMRAVADVMMTSTSTVSQQIATLAREAGTVRAGGFATAVRRMLMPVVGDLARTHPRVRVIVHELEPDEAREALLADRIDLALVYDYDLAPAALDRLITAYPLEEARLGLAVPAEAVPEEDLTSPELFARFARSTWIGNSRNPAEEALLRVLAAMAGFEPQIDHLVDSLDLVEELILARQGVGLLHLNRDRRPGLSVIPLRDPSATSRTYALTRQGQAAWPPLALMLGKLSSSR